MPFRLFILSLACAISCAGASITTTDIPTPDAADALIKEASIETESIRAACAVDRPWKAQWIGADVGVNGWTCYRTTITVPQVPKSVPTRMAADTTWWLWINGTLVVRQSGLKRGPTPSDTYADEYDIAKYLKIGSNTIAILHWYMGKEGFSHKNSGKSGLIFEADLGSAQIISDKNWKMRIHPAFSSTTKPVPNFRLPESNIRFDAQKDLGDWMSSAYDDKTWDAAQERGKAGEKPWGKLIRRPIPLWQDNEPRAFVSTEQKKNVLVANLSFNQQFSACIEVDAPAGRVIDIRTDSFLIVSKGRTGQAEPTRAEYVTKAGKQSFETFDWLSGHKLQLTIPDDVKVVKLSYRPQGYATNVVGHFSCNDTFYDTLWQKAARTLTINMRDTWMDCPERERAQWWGDVVVDIGQATYALDQRAELLTSKGLLELAAWQRPDKTMFAPIPAGNWDKELSLQTLAAVGHFGAWTYYKNTGDLDTLKTIYPAIKTYLLDVWKQHPDGLVVHRKGGWDWADFGKESDIDVPLLDNAWYVLALDGGAQMAAAVGQNADVTAFTSRADKVRARFNDAFWNNNHYRSPGHKGDTDDRGNAMAVLAGFAKPAQYPAIKKVLASHTNASAYMEKYVLDAIFMMGDAELGLSRMKKRYQSMVDSWCTTLWENLGNSGTNNHAWAGGPLITLSQYVAGIANDGIAFDRFHVLPQMGSLTTVSARVPTHQGLIVVDLKRTTTSFTMTLRVPNNTQALAGLPINGAAFKSMTINGAAADTLPNTKSTEIHDGYHCFSVGAGIWTIVGNF